MLDMNQRTDLPKVHKASSSEKTDELSVVFCFLTASLQIQEQG
jgi:hypothetical protein